jgi:hypothetical protein
MRHSGLEARRQIRRGKFSEMSKVLLGKALVPASIAMAGLLLAGCGSMTTYGTGKSAAMQTIEDVGGIVSLGGRKHDAVAIDYKQRPSVVEPPSTAVLPPPKSADQLAMAGDWPNDPDEADKRAKAQVQEAVASGQDLTFEMPGGSKPPSPPRSDNRSGDVRREKMIASANPQEQKKLFAEARMAKTGSVDAAGNPVRKYLTEPPVDYRAPDPNAPVVITEKPKKKGSFKWPDLWPF